MQVFTFSRTCFHFQIPTEEGNAFAQQHNMPFVEVSAKQGIRVQEAFAAITEQLYR